MRASSITIDPSCTYRIARGSPHHGGTTMSGLPLDTGRTVSPAGFKQVAFDHKCQVIPEGDCVVLRKLLSLCPTRAQSPPIVDASSRSAGLIARAISPPFARAVSPTATRAKSPNPKRASGVGNAPSSWSTSWKTRLTSWGSVESNTIAANLSAAFGAPPQSSSAGPRLVAPVPARGTPGALMRSNDDNVDDTSPSNESIISFDDIDAEFQHAVSGVAMHQHQAPVATVVAGPPGRSVFQPSRRCSPFVRSVSEMQHRRPVSAGTRKSCLVRSKTPQAPGARSLMDDGMEPLRATRSHDQNGCSSRRRRADGVPVVCASPLGSPQDERGAACWGADASGSNTAKDQKPTAQTSEKCKVSGWRRFRRAASEEGSQRYERRSSSSSPSGGMLGMHMDDVAIKRQIQAGRWPFEARLNAECSCKNCQDRIEVGLASDYEPKWTRAARMRWLEAQEDAAVQSRRSESRSSGRAAIQADEVAQLHNQTAHPMTAAELAQESTSPSVERDEPSLSATAEAANPTGLEEGDDTLRREIIARRQRSARQSPVMRHGARSMMRQIEEAERREEEAARDRTRSRWCGSGHSSACSRAMSPSLPCTPEPTWVSTTPQQRTADGTAASTSYFELHLPPQRVRSPLMRVDVA